MVRTSTAERNNYVCPECGDELSQDAAGRGFVKHMSNPGCRFEGGQRDSAGTPSSDQLRSLSSEAGFRVSDLSGASIDRLRGILDRANSDRRVMPPTELFNEGWLLRLALDWFADNPDAEHPLQVPCDARWYSEALLPTQFAARSRGDSLSESHTHADGVVGHFKIGDTGEGDLALELGASHLAVFEAKLNSRLSSGVKNAPGYDQAARYVACIAHILSVARVRPETMSRLGFYIVAPSVQISRRVFASELTKDSIRDKVTQRAKAYDSRAKESWLCEWFLPTLEAIEIDALSWEDVGSAIDLQSDRSGSWFAEFYGCCLRYNRVAA